MDNFRRLKVKCYLLHLFYSLLLLSLHFTSTTFANEQHPTGSVLNEDDRSMLLNLINPCGELLFNYTCWPKFLEKTFRRIHLWQLNVNFVFFLSSPSLSPSRLDFVVFSSLFLCVHFILHHFGNTAIAAAVFGAPAVPYVIPCTILRRIRLFRETLSPSSSPSSSSPSSAAAFSQPVSSVISGLMTDRQKLLIGNFILGTSSSGSSSSSSSSSIFKRWSNQSASEEENE